MAQPAVNGRSNILTKLDQRVPTRFLWQLTLLATLGGFLFGYDTSNIGSALNFVPYHLKGLALGYLVSGASLGAAAGAAARGAEHQPQVASRQHGEGRRGMHHLGEVQVPAVEVDGGIDVVHDVANAHSSHDLNLRPHHHRRSARALWKFVMGCSSSPGLGRRCGLNRTAARECPAWLSPR